MLDINIEFVKGVLIVRIEGKMNSINTKKIEFDLKRIIETGGIKNLIFNLDNAILEERIVLFDICNSLIRLNNGKMYICGLNKKMWNIINSEEKNYIKYKDVLSALKRMNLC